MIYLQHPWSGQTVVVYLEQVSGGKGSRMGRRAPYGYGQYQAGWSPDPQDASTWPSGGHTQAYPPPPVFPSRPLQPLYPPPPAEPSRPLSSLAPIIPQSQPRVVYVVQQAPSTPVIVEVIGGLFGFYGIGWLVGGYTFTGILLVLGSLVLAGLWAVVTVATVGVGLFCVIPANLAILLTSTLTLNARLKRKLEGQLHRRVKS